MAALMPITPKSIVMIGTMIVAMAEPEYEARARRELTSYIAAKLGLSHSITLACYADYPLEDLWRLGLVVYRCTMLPAQQMPA